jgi:hypothetical protein
MSNVLLVPGTVSVRFAVDPVYNNLASLYLLDFADEHPKANAWLREAPAGLSGEQKRAQLVLVEILYSAHEPDEDWRLTWITWPSKTLSSCATGS